MRGFLSGRGTAATSQRPLCPSSQRHRLPQVHDAPESTPLNLHANSTAGPSGTLFNLEHLLVPRFPRHAQCDPHSGWITRSDGPRALGRALPGSTMLRASRLTPRSPRASARSPPQPTACSVRHGRQRLSVRWFGSAFRNPYCYLPCSRRAVDDAGSRRPAPRNQTVSEFAWWSLSFRELIRPAIAHSDVLEDDLLVVDARR